MSTIKSQLTADMKAAMRAKQKLQLTTMRMALAAIKQKEIDEKLILSDAEVSSIITKMIKQRKDSAEQYNAADRKELADKELAEIEYLVDYLPEALTADELQALIQQSITETQVSSIKEMGQVMNHLRPQIQGRADMGEVANLIKSAFA